MSSAGEIWWRCSPGPELLTINVADRVVTLRGHLERRSQVDRLVELVRRVDVVDELSYGRAARRP
ncbi:hypothetical protein GCM10009539_05560 [Cryptosporangium japonicum]|uniref:BON domain-containing protein n=1 Tax=Cryptosporangium japonicum TaxID=80872 RepID=A0ABN0TJG4_9ACTN